MFTVTWHQARAPASHTKTNVCVPHSIKVKAKKKTVIKTEQNVKLGGAAKV